MPTNLIPKQQPPTRKPQQPLGLKVWYAVLIPAQPFILLGFFIGLFTHETALSILCLMLFVSTAVWVTVLSIMYGRLHLLPRMFLATWSHVIYYVTQPRAFQRMAVTGFFYVLPAMGRTLLVVPFILVGMGSEAYANKVCERFWEKELTHFANHKQRLQRMGLAP